MAKIGSSLAAKTLVRTTGNKFRLCGPLQYFSKIILFRIHCFKPKIETHMYELMIFYIFINYLEWATIKRKVPSVSRFCFISIVEQIRDCVVVSLFHFRLENQKKRLCPAGSSKYLQSPESSLKLQIQSDSQGHVNNRVYHLLQHLTWHL